MTDPAWRYSRHLRRHSWCWRRRAGVRRRLRVRAAGRRPRRRRDRWRAAFASTTAARSGSPASSAVATDTAKRHEPRCRPSSPAATSRCTATTTRPTAMAARPPSSSRRLGHTRCKASCCAGRGAGFRRYRRQGLRSRPGRRRRRRARGQKGHLGRPRGHKKRGKYRRYFGRDWAFYAGRGQGSVRSAGGGNDLPELRTELDTGLCCDYFKAHIPAFESGRHWRLSHSKIDGFGFAACVEARGGPRIEVLGRDRLKCWAGTSA